MSAPERRAALACRVEQRSGKAPKIVGHAAVFNSETTIAGQFREVVKPGAFKRTLATAQDVFALFNHNPDKILGRRKAKTLSLREDSRGLAFEITPPDTAMAREVLESLRRGDLDGASFAFTVPAGGDRWSGRAALPLRELLDVDLLDVSIVAYAAYPDAGSALRTMRAGGFVNSILSSTLRLRTARNRLRLAELDNHARLHSAAGCAGPRARR